MSRYSDLNLDFVPHPMTGDVTILTDMEALKRSIRNLVFTSKYERRFRPELDAGIRRYLFEPMTSITAVRIKNAIENVIKNFEPRVEVISVVVNANESRNAFDVSIVFRPKNVNQTTQVNLILERTR
jgi:phage baseplate assembly protein W